MKKLYFALALFAAVLMATPTQAAMVITPDRTTMYDTVNINCTSDTDYYGIYRSTTKEQVVEGECDGNNVDVGAVGTFIVGASVADQEGQSYYDLTFTETANVQVDPNFSTGDSTVMMNAPFSNFLTAIGTFLTTNLPAVLTVLAALIGLGFLIRRVKRWIGKKA